MRERGTQAGFAILASLCSLLMLALVLHAASAQDTLPSPGQDELAKKAVLDLDPGRHVGGISYISFRAAGKQIVTVGNDRTVQISDALTGERLRVFHLPSHPKAAALSPDGKTLLISRDPAPERGPDKPAVSIAYLLNLQDGRILPLAAVGTGAAKGWFGAAAFSADGDRAFVGHPPVCWAWGGLENVWDVEDTSEKAKADARFHFDGELTAHVGIAARHDGKRVALAAREGGFHIWDLTDLARPVKAFDWASPAGKVGGMAWSRDGKHLAVADFAHNTGPRSALRLWSPDGKLQRSYTVATRHGDRWDGNIDQLVYRGDNEVLLFCQTGSYRYVLSVNLMNGFVHEIVRTDPFDAGSAVGALSRDGKHIALADGPARTRLALAEVKENARFRWADGGAWREPAKVRDRFEPRHVGWSATGHAIAGNLRNPKQLDTALDLEKLEVWTSIDPAKFLQTVHKRNGWELRIDSDAPTTSRIQVRHDDKVVGHTPSGTDVIRQFTLPRRGEPHWLALARGGGFSLYDSSGKRPHAFSTPSVVIGLSPSADDGYLLASTNTQLLSVYKTEAPAGPARIAPLLHVYFSGPEWVAWTGKGYYAASPGGERLMGWRIDNGPNALAGFYPAAQFHASLYRPDVISLLLEKGSLKHALEAANAAKGLTAKAPTNVEEILPPKVTLVAPGLKGDKVSSPALDVEATAVGRGKLPVVSLQLVLDGRPYGGADGRREVKAALGATVKESWKVELPEGDHTLRVIARSEASMGLSDDLDVTYAVKAPLPKLYLLAIGIDDYKAGAGVSKLSCAVNDARELDETFRKQSKDLFDPQPPRVLTDGQATRKNILEALDSLKQMTARDLAVIYYAGHGERDARGNFYLLPQDVNLMDLEKTGISGKELKDRLAGLPGKVLLLLDACHSGAVGKVISELTRDLAGEDCGVVVLCAALGSETAGEDKALRHGYFCLAILEALRGEGAKSPRDGFVYQHHLEQHVIDRVQVLSKDEQHPTSAKPTIRPFPLARP